MSEEESQQLAERLQASQPFIMVYLLAAEEMESERPHPGWLLELGGLICEVMTRAQPKLPTVTGDELDAAEEKNTKCLHALEEESEMQWTNTIEHMMQHYAQAPLLGKVIELLMAGHEEIPELAGEEVGIGLLHLKTVIDCLDAN